MNMINELGLEVYSQYTEGRKVQQLGGDTIKTYQSTIPSLSPIALLDLNLFMNKVYLRLLQVCSKAPLHQHGLPLCLQYISRLTGSENWFP